MTLRLRFCPQVEIADATHSTPCATGIIRIRSAEAAANSSRAASAATASQQEVAVKERIGTEVQARSAGVGTSTLGRDVGVAPSQELPETGRQDHDLCHSNTRKKLETLVQLVQHFGDIAQVMMIKVEDTPDQVTMQKKPELTSEQR